MKPLKGWIVFGFGHPLWETVRPTKKEAIEEDEAVQDNWAYSFQGDVSGAWKDVKERYQRKLVRIEISEVKTRRKP